MNPAVSVLEQIRDILAQRSASDSGAQPTARNGAELPLVMAEPVIADKDLVGAGPTFSDVVTQDIHHYTLGNVLVACDSTKPIGTGIYFYAAEVQVFGVVQGVPDLLASFVINSSTGPARVLLPLGSSYNSIVVQARQIVNGVPSALNANNVTGVTNMTGARLRLAARARIYR